MFIGLGLSMLGGCLSMWCTQMAQKAAQDSLRIQQQNQQHYQQRPK
jgi:hypothetical protein